MTKRSLFIIFFCLAMSPSVSLATLDIRLGGSYGLGVGNNQEVLPRLDDGETQSFTASGYNLDVIMSDYWIVLGARLEESSSKTETFFYFDQASNQYTKYSVSTKGRTYSALVGVHFELNTELSIPNANKVLYSAGIFAVIPFDQSNQVDIESRNSIATSKISGSANSQQEWAVYVEANRAVQGGLTAGLQMGYKHHILKDYEDNNGNSMSTFNGNPLELNLSYIDFRIFLGIRF